MRKRMHGCASGRPCAQNTFISSVAAQSCKLPELIFLLFVMVPATINIHK